MSGAAEAGRKRSRPPDEEGAGAGGAAPSAWEQSLLALIDYKSSSFAVAEGQEAATVSALAAASTVRRSACYRRPARARF